jgi:RNA polymerase sigma factor (sigma-70 family)
VTELASSEGWPLSPADIERLANDVLPYVQQLKEATPKAIQQIAHHYRQDGPMVRAMLREGSADGERLWRQWRAFFLRLAAQKGVFGKDAEDLAQIACERALRGLARFGFRSSLKTWMSSLFVNCYLSWIRHKKALKRQVTRQVSLEAETEKGQPIAELIHGSGPSLEERQERRELRGLLDAEIDRLLKSDDVTILRLYYVERQYVDERTGEPRKWTDEAIGRKLDLPRNTITSKRRRALERLRQNRAIRDLAYEILGITIED